MKTAVIYARYSSNSQTEQSIEGQLRVCHDYAVKNNIIILKEYIDRAMTGTNDNRPDFKRMLADSSKKQWDIVLVYKFDRFSRNQYEQVIHEHTLTQNGIKLISATEPIPTESIGSFMKGMIISYNEFYSKELAEKVRRGMKETRLKGYFQGGTLLYGYKLEGRKIVPDEKEKEVVKYIFEQYKAGVYLKDIIAKLNSKGITKRGKPFLQSCVYDMLRNEKYIGIYKHENEEIKEMYPQILPNDLFDSVRRKIEANKYGRTSVKVEYLLRHKLKCGYCGENINGECGTTSKGERIYYYKCNGRKKRVNDCNKSIIKKDLIENIVIDSIIKELSRPQNIDYIVDQIMKVQEELSKQNPNLTILVKEQKQLKSKLDNIVKAIEMGVINKTTNQRMKELEEQLEEIAKQILIEKSKNSIKLTEKEIREYYVNALQLEPKILINYIVKEVKLFDDKVEIIFNSPIKKSPDSQGFLLYKNFKSFHGSKYRTEHLMIEIYID